MSNEITQEILRLSFKIHSKLGSGLLESSYKECLFYELTKAGFDVEKEKGLPIVYEQVSLPIGYRMDLLVENTVVVENKSVDAFTDKHIAQMITYLKLSGCSVGLLLNFKMPSLKDGIKRIKVNHNFTSDIRTQSKTPCNSELLPNNSVS